MAGTEERQIPCGSSLLPPLMGKWERAGSSRDAGKLCQLGNEGAKQGGNGTPTSTAGAHLSFPSPLAFAVDGSATYRALSPRRWTNPSGSGYFLAERSERAKEHPAWSLKPLAKAAPLELREGQSAASKPLGLALLVATYEGTQEVKGGVDE